jgi:hypothetical protein
MVDQEVGMKETNDNDIERHELCRRQKAISISCGAKYLRTCLQPEEQLDEIAFSFLEGVGTIRTPLNLYPTRAVSTERHAKRRA